MTIDINEESKIEGLTPEQKEIINSGVQKILRAKKKYDSVVQEQDKKFSELANELTKTLSEMEDKDPMKDSLARLVKKIQEYVNSDPDVRLGEDVLEVQEAMQEYTEEIDEANRC